MKRHGFSLLEVIVALGILAMIGLITLQTIAGALDTRDVLEEEDQSNQSARVNPGTSGGGRAS